MRSTLKTIAGAGMALAVMVALAAPAPATAREYHSTCANRLCTKDKPQVKSCKRFDRRKRVARCFIRRAARHFHQSKRRAYYIAWRESRYNWRVTNPSSGTAGLYQFAHQTWESTPYRHHSPYSPRYASLAAMWMWAHGGYSHWS
jgi:hypothetical protein